MRPHRSLVISAVIAASFAGSWLAAGASAPRTAEAQASQPVGLVSVNPVRVLDTRARTKLPTDGEVVVSTGITGAGAVAVNITLTETDGGGYVTAWAGGLRPNTSIINSSGAGENIANFAIVPVDAAGSFRLYTSNPAHLIVDLMGYFPGTPVAPDAPTVTGPYTVAITGYSPGFRSTSIIGTVTNGDTTSHGLQVEVRCPDGRVTSDAEFVTAGASEEWIVNCSDVFVSGAVATVIPIV